MSKFALEIELVDERFCEGCQLFTSYKPYDYGGHCAIIPQDLRQDDDTGFTLRSKKCPLKPVLTQQPAEIPHIEFTEEGVQTC